jgi:hypothetical protein
MATRNCTRDEGGPFGFGNQALIPSHCKLLQSIAVLVGNGLHWVQMELRALVRPWIRGGLLGERFIARFVLLFYSAVEDNTWLWK